MKTQSTQKRWLIIIVISIILSACNAERNNPKIVFVSDKGLAFNLYLMNPDGSDINPLTNDISRNKQPELNRNPKPSPDGNQIVFESNRNGNIEIYSLDISTGNEVNLTKNNADDVSPTWFPDGKHIAFVSDRDSVPLFPERGIRSNNIYVMEADGSNIVRLTKDNTTGTFGELECSPDGEKILLHYSALTAEGGFFYRGLNLLNIKNLHLKIIDPNYDQLSNWHKWSPNGEFIIFTRINEDSENKYVSNIFFMNADGTNIKQITNDKNALNTDPTWLPDGKSILFSSNIQGNYDIYSMNIDGSNRIPITHDRNNETNPIWIESKR